MEGSAQEILGVVVSNPIVIKLDSQVGLWIFRKPQFS